MLNSRMGMSGQLGTKLIKAQMAPLSWRIRNKMRAEYIRGWMGDVLAWQLSRRFHTITYRPRLYARLIKADGQVVNYGKIGVGRLVTTAFVEYQVDEMIAETSAWGDFKFHDSGVGTTGAAIGDTDIETTDAESRVAGTQLEGATGEIYKSVGTISYTTTKAITEHGLFNIVTAGILCDRHVFAAINVVNGDSIQFTYELTIDDGG